MHGQILSVCIVTYNSASTIRECLSRVLSGLEPEDKVIVVDNASSDSTVEAVRRELNGTKHHLIKNAENIFYTRAANQALRKTRGEFALLLNPDCYLFPGWRKRLLQPFRWSKVATVGPVCDNTAGRQYVEQQLGALRPGLTVEQLEELTRIHNAGTLETAKLLMGFCLMLRRSALDECGVLNERLVLGADDLELCWRLRVTGHELAIARDCFVHHEGQVSFRSLDESKKQRLLDEADQELLRILTEHYEPEPVPSSVELWGIPIFAPLA